MWFGTVGGGINTFDGKYFNNWGSKEGLVDDLVYFIYRDNQGIIYIGTNNGLSVIHSDEVNKPNKKPFKNFTVKEGLSHPRILSIWDKGDGEFWFGTGKGLSVLKNGIIKPFYTKSILDSASVFHIMKDSEGAYWFSTIGEGAFRLHNNTIKQYSLKEGLNSSFVFSVLEKKPGYVWLLTGEGVYELINDKPQEIKMPYLGTSATYYHSLIDKNKAIWLAAAEGLLKLGVNEEPRFFTKANGLADNSVWKVFEDKESNLWLASDQNGVSKLSSERFILFNSKDALAGDEVKRIYQDNQKNIWVGTKQGLSYDNGKSEKKFNKVDFKGTQDIWAIALDNNGVIYAGTSNGLVTGKEGNFKRIFCSDKESPANAIIDVYIDKAGEIWLGTQAGVARFKNDMIVESTEIPLQKSFIHKVYQDNKGVYWFCSDDGLFRYDGKELKGFSGSRGLTENTRVRNIIQDSKNTYWLATSTGLYKYDGTIFEIVQVGNSETSKEIFSLAIDQNNVLWAGLSNGLASIELGEKRKVRLYSSEDGFLGQVCNQNALIIDDQNRPLVGTSNGLVVYQRQYEKDNTAEPITKIKSVDLFFQKVDWKEYADSVSNNNLPINLSLPYDKNYLTFNFIGVSLTTPGKVTYRYKLEGLDKDWRLSNKTEASYSNLPPGKYRFLCYANNGEGVWNTEPVTFEFEIRPPFWRTWWFYSLVVLIISSGVYSYIKISAANRKILKQNEIIEEKNSALSHANEEIAEKNRNITDSINYAKRIQQSFIPSDKLMAQILPQHFVLFKPRDIVSGDFYQAFELEDRLVVVCADCTGHGIPGAFMSLIGISIIKEISKSSKEITSADILNKLREGILDALNPDRSEQGAKDGMDVTILCIFKKKNGKTVRLQFSGANNPLIHVTTEEGTKRIVEYKGDKQPAGYYSNMKPFGMTEIEAKEGDGLYLYTDGFADQFGGTTGKKFMSKKLKELIADVSDLSMKEQKEQFNDVFVKWQGSLEQVDDVTLIGIRV
jgi:ligand-binding sensor domain-containing protein/serine phosphatase RsbU (regulator of sigma subunit)